MLKQLLKLDIHKTNVFKNIMLINCLLSCWHAFFPY